MTPSFQCYAYSMNWRSFGFLILFMVLAQLAGLVGSFSTFPNIETWYAGLTKPSFNPPSWVFGPVWTVLYSLMGIATWFVWRSTKPGKVKAIGLFIVHLFVNAAWSMVFFGAHQPLYAFGIIVVLWLFIIALIRMYYPYSKVGAWLLVPYLLWVTFASTLNFSIAYLNGYLS